VYIISVCQSSIPSISDGSYVNWNASATYIDGDEVEYACNPLFTPSTGVITCTPTGSWNPPSNLCERGNFVLSFNAEYEVVSFVYSLLYFNFIIVLRYLFHKLNSHKWNNDFFQHAHPSELKHVVIAKFLRNVQTHQGMYMYMILLIQ